MGMFRRFCRYSAKVFKLPALTDQLSDTRRQPFFSTQEVWGTALSLIVTGRPSLYSIEADRRRGGQKGTRPPSDDTLGRVFNLFDIDPLRQMLVTIMHQLKRNKAVTASGNLIFAAVDGHEFFFPVENAIAPIVSNGK